MTSCVTLSRARPRNPFRSPARIQRGELGCPDVGDPPSGDQLPREALGPFREGRAPREAAAVIGDVVELEFDRWSELTTKAQPRAVRLPFTLVVGVENDLDTRIDALGVRGQKIPQPASDFLVGPAGKHGGILAPGDRSDHLPVREAAAETWCVRQAVAGLGPARRGTPLESWRGRRSAPPSRSPISTR